MSQIAIKNWLCLGGAGYPQGPPTSVRIVASDEPPELLEGEQFAPVRSKPTELEARVYAAQLILGSP